MDSNTLSRTYLFEQYKEIRKKTLQICQPLEKEDFVIQPAGYVSPPKWHLAHTTWFFEELVLKASSTRFKPYHPQFGLLFNSYYKTLGQHWLQADRGLLSRPTVEEIYDYRHAVDEQMQELLSYHQLDETLCSIVEIGLHHEQQHQELLFMDIKYILGINPIPVSYSSIKLPESTAANQTWFSYDGGLVTVGHDSLEFSYDNEKPSHQYYLSPYLIANNLVSNGDYLEFIEAGTYSNPKYWLSLGWDWVQQHKINAPLYWQKIDGEWFEFTLHGWQKLDVNSPLVHISYFEADAYATWHGSRLPSEFELEIYLKTQPLRENNELFFHPTCLSQVKNQVWCWTRSAYAPYPGFKPLTNALQEYNGKFMCNQYVLKGGCMVTPQNHYRDSYRNFFPPDLRWMFSGVRLAKDRT